MGRAIVRDPQVFLFDEPLSNLDAKLRVQMRAEILELHQRLGTTTIYVTHDQIEAMTMADKIVVMQAGIIEQIGTPLALYDTPANIFVDDFTGRMEVVGAPDELPPVQAEVQAAIDAAAGKSRPMVGIERFDFYERAKNAYVVIQTGERRLYGCFMFRKGGDRTG